MADKIDSIIKDPEDESKHTFEIETYNMTLAQTDPTVGVLANKATLLKGILKQLEFEEKEKEPFKMVLKKY